MNKLFSVLFTLVLISMFSLNTNKVQAAKCSINFNYGVIIDPSHVRMIERGQTRVQINNDQQLFIDGKEVPLSIEQKQLLKQFSTGIRQQIPSIVTIAIEGVNIGLDAVNKIIASLTGENSTAHQKIQTKFEELKWRIRTRFNQSDQNYYIAPQDLNDFDKIFAGEFEQELDDIVSDSIGTLLSVIGESMLNNDKDENAEQRITTFDDRMEKMAQDLELEVDIRASNLEKKAIQFCQALTELNLIETQLHHSIPDLTNFNLIDTN